MPGRPRTTVKRLDELRSRVAEVGDDLFALVPAQYFNQPASTDPLCIAWQSATDATIENYRALSKVLELVAAKVK